MSTCLTGNLWKQNATSFTSSSAMKIVEDPELTNEVSRLSAVSIYWVGFLSGFFVAILLIGAVFYIIENY
jgi:hypothetical protein